MTLATERPEILLELRAKAVGTVEAQRARRAGGEAREATDEERAALEELGYGGGGSDEEE